MSGPTVNSPIGASGVSIKVTADTRELSAAFARLEKTGGQAMVQRALKSIGEVLLNSTRKRFNEQVDPQGQRWAPLNTLYAQGKKGTKILQASGQLFASIHPVVTPGQLQIGTNKIYGAVHQFGATIVPRAADALIFRMGGRLIHAQKVTIPARPFLGLSSSDRKDAVQAATDIYDAAWTSSP